MTTQSAELIHHEFHGEPVTVEILTHGDDASFWFVVVGGAVRTPLDKRYDQDEDEAPYCYFTHVDEYMRYDELRIYADGSIATLNY